MSYLCDPDLHNSIFKIPSVKKKMYNKLEDQVFIMQDSQGNLPSEITDMKSYMKKRDYDMC